MTDKEDKGLMSLNISSTFMTKANWKKRQMICVIIVTVCYKIRQRSSLYVFIRKKIQQWHEVISYTQ